LSIPGRLASQVDMRRPGEQAAFRQ